jgi:hypothetical protein
MIILGIRKKRKNKWPLRILPSGRPLRVGARKGVWMVGLVPRTGTDERIVLAHCVGTRCGYVGLGKCHGHCARVVAGESVGSSQLIGRWGLLMGSISGATYW